MEIYAHNDVIMRQKNFEIDNLSHIYVITAACC